MKLGVPFPLRNHHFGWKLVFSVANNWTETKVIFQILSKQMAGEQFQLLGISGESCMYRTNVPVYGKQVNQ